MVSISKNKLGAAAFSAARSVASKVVYSSGSPEQVAMAKGNQDISHTYASNRGSNPHSNNGNWKPTPGFSSGGGVNNSGSNGNSGVSWNDGARSGRGVGGVWGGGGGQGSQGAPETSQRSASSDGGLGNTGGGDADGTYERQLVVDLCAPGGTRAVPPQDELNRFIKLAPSLSPSLIGPNLLEQVL